MDLRDGENAATRAQLAKWIDDTPLSCSSIINTRRAAWPLIRRFHASTASLTSSTTAGGHRCPSLTTKWFAKKREYARVNCVLRRAQNRATNSISWPSIDARKHRTSKSQCSWNCRIMGFGIEFNGSPLRCAQVINAHRNRTNTR